jgi:hypothetical protein
MRSKTPASNPGFFILMARIVEGLADTVTKCLANPLAGNSEKLDELPQELHLRHLFNW